MSYARSNFISVFKEINYSKKRSYIITTATVLYYR